MYIYFDTNGTIKEVINDESIRRGSSDYNKIYCYLEGEPEIDDIWYLQKLPSGELSNEVSFKNSTITKAIPYDAKRDMKYFKDFEQYTFYVFTLNTFLTSQKGLNIATIRVSVDNTIWALGELTFNVQENVINVDNGITQSQYDYLLLAYASRTLSEQTGSDLNTLLDDKINAKLGDLASGSPKVFDTEYNIEHMQDDEGIAVATDTGYIYVFNDTQREYQNTGMKYIADVSLFYTKTESDTTFAPKSTALTHTGNQLKDYSGNNVYPNLADGQVNTSNLADGCVTQQKLETKLSILVDKAYNKKTTSKTINCYVDDKDNFSSYTGPNQYWGYNNSIPKNTYIKSISFRCYANSKLTFYLCSLSGSTYTIEKTISEATYNNSNNAINIGYFTDDKEIYIIVGGSANGGGIYYSSATNGTGKLVNYTKSSDTFAVSQNLNKWQYAISYDFNVFIEPNSVITVSKDGTGDFKTINEALTYAYTIESKNNPITIIIYPAVYKEVCDIKGTHFVSLIGVNRDTCIIRDDTGIYNNCPLRIEGNSYIANLTLIATHNDTADFVVGGELQYNASYALHIDDRHADNDDDYRVTVFNCRCYSEQNPAVGIGLDKNTTLELVQCEFERNEIETVNSVKSGVWAYRADGGAFFYHALYSGHYTDDTGYQKMTVKDCVFKNNKNYCVYGESGGMMTQVTTTFINNVGHSASGFTAHRLSQETLSQLSFGNNITTLNYTE